MTRDARRPSGELFESDLFYIDLIFNQRQMSPFVQNRQTTGGSRFIFYTRLAALKEALKVVDNIRASP